MFSLGKNNRIKDERFSAVCHARALVKEGMKLALLLPLARVVKKMVLTDRLANAIDCKGSNGGFEKGVQNQC